MEQEKDLLIKVLCEMLPYGVRIAKGNVIYPMTGINIALGYVELAVSERVLIKDARPYLRLLSSMTEEEKKEYNYMVFDYEYDDYWYPGKYTDAICVGGVDELVDWLNAHHFDYRGLIEKGLALEAPEGMYKEE